MPGLFKADGSRVTKASFPATASPDPVMVVSETLYAKRRYDRTDGDAEGSIRVLALRAGDKLPQSQIDKLFPAATVDTVSPASGPAAGGTVVTITGTNLDGVTVVRFGATAGTSLVIDSPEKLRVTTPAGTAGAANVVLTDDSGTTTKTGGFTYS